MNDKHVIAAVVGGGALVLGIAIVVVLVSTRDPQIPPNTTPGLGAVNVSAAGVDPRAASNSVPGSVQLQIDSNYVAGQSYVVTGTTNLPAGTHLVISVTRDGPEGALEDFTTTVGADGRFVSRPFGPRDGLEPAQYLVDVLAPISKVQPESVRQMTGEHGENLIGPLVERTKQGTVVRAEKLVLHVPGDQPAPRTSLSLARQRRRRVSDPRIN